MHIAGIIAEYDPFHNGHAYHIKKTKSAGADAVVVAIGGEFTQRGDPAWCSKYARARCAVSGGADLVVEIPVPYAMGSAERFAEGGITVLNSLGCVNTLSFGSESGNGNDIVKYALMENSDDFLKLVKEELKNGISTPQARQNAAEKICPEIAYISKNPNDILAKEYMKWILREKSDITLSPAVRYGVNHNEEYSLRSGIASASYIRTFEDPQDIMRFVPGYVSDILKTEFENGKCPTDMEKYETLVMSVLRTKTLADYKEVPDSESEGLYNRVYRAVKETNTLEDLYNEIKTKRYTMTRVKRIIAGSILGLSEEKIKWAGIPYVRVLAMNETGKKILKESENKARLPIGYSLKDLSKISKQAEYIADKESLSEDLWQICRNNAGICGNAYTEKLFVL